MGLAAVAVALTLRGPRLVVRSSTEFDSLLKTQYRIECSRVQGELLERIFEDLDALQSSTVQRVYSY